MSYDTILRNGPFSGIALGPQAQENEIRGNAVSDNNMLHLGAGAGGQTMGIRLEGPEANDNVVADNVVNNNGADGIVVLSTCDDMEAEPPCVGTPPNERNQIVGNTATDVGETPYGRRRIATVTGGHFEGEELKGIVLPSPAGDWLLLRRGKRSLAGVKVALKISLGRFPVRSLAAAQPTVRTSYSIFSSVTTVCRPHALTRIRDLDFDQRRLAWSQKLRRYSFTHVQKRTFQAVTGA